MNETKLHAALVEALRDMAAGWRYIRETHGDLYGVGWDRAEDKAKEALALAATWSSATAPGPDGMQHCIAVPGMPSAARDAALELARADQSPVPVTNEELAAFHRFCDCCEDFDAGGHDVPKTMISQLVRIGLLRPAGPGRNETTKFGDWMRDCALKSIAAPVAAPSETTYEADDGTVAARRNGELVWHTHIYGNGPAVDEVEVAKLVASALNAARPDASETDGQKGGA